MVNGDLSNVKKKRPKIAVSLSLDKENMDILKEDMKNSGKQITLSGVFDYWLNQFAKSILERNKKKESEVKKEDD